MRIFDTKGGNVRHCFFVTLFRNHLQTIDQFLNYEKKN